MSSSWGNTINLNDEPEDMYGKVMSLNDDLLEMYFVYCTRVPLEDVEKMKNSIESGDLHLKEMKMKLAKEIVKMYHGEKKAEKSEKMFVNTFQKKEIPENIEVYESKKGIKLVDILLEHGVVDSKSNWRRLIDGKGVHDITKDEKTIEDVDVVLEKNITVRIGKRTFLKFNAK